MYIYLHFILVLLLKDILPLINSSFILACANRYIFNFRPKTMSRYKVMLDQLSFLHGETNLFSNIKAFLVLNIGGKRQNLHVGRIFVAQKVNLLLVMPTSQIKTQDSSPSFSTFHSASS